MITQAQLQEAKKAARQELQNIDGVQGFGLGEACLNIYIRNPEVKRNLPDEFHGVPLNFITTGDIQPFERPAKQTVNS
jgi:hypothetical protein